MAIKVIFQSAPFVGKSLDFNDAKKTIRVGRSVDCEVQFPEEIAIVGHEHFALVRSVGVYKFVINTKHRVFCDGKDVFDGQELHGVTQVRLGAHDGPCLLLEPQAATGANLINTVPQGLSPEIGRVSLLTRKWTAVVGAAVVILAVSGYWIADDMFRTKLSLFEQLAKKGDFSSVVSKYQQSVFLVDEVDSAGNSAGGATAWVVALSDGRRVFATNAHVGKMLEDARKKGHTLLVRSPIGGHAEFKIAEAVIHPAFDKFSDLMAETQERAEKTGLIRTLQLPPAYDVAVLIPEIQNGIPEPLTLASQTSLDSLHSGQPVLMLGYPAEKIINFDPKSPSPTAQVGVITAVRSFFLASDNSEKQLIQHSLPATGGASGSPILNEQGEVIGLLNAGNITSVESGRIPNAALINFGQRSDLLKEIIDGTAESKLSSYSGSWKIALERWKRDAQSVIQKYVEGFQDEFGPLQSVTLKGETGTTDPLFGTRLVDTKEFELKAGTPYLLTTQSREEKTIYVFFIDKNDKQKTKLIDSRDFFNGGPLGIVFTKSSSNLRAAIAIVSGETEPSKDERGKPIMVPKKSPVSYEAKLYWPAKSK